MTKQEIRNRMRARRVTVDAASRRAASQSIAATLLARAEFRRAQEVACFLSLPQEIETDDLLAACHAQGKQVCVPVWDARLRTYVLARLAPDARRIAGPHDVPEPMSWTPVDPQTVDLAIVPGMAFDRHGGRLGYGKGYYDRILAECRPDCRKIGVGYAWQVVDGDLPLASHDVRMDLLVTDAGMVVCGERIFTAKDARVAKVGTLEG